MSENKPLIEPRVLKGFQDFLPEEVLARKAVVEVCESVFRTYGFVPLQTPALEYLDTLLGTGGEETNKELFRLETPEGEPIAMRFDQTVPFARMMAQYPDKLKVPFRRYAIGPVWRGDRPGPGRFREFTQIDIDAAGSDSVAVDAEIIAVVCEIMTKLGANDFCVLVNNRKLIDALLEGCGIAGEAKAKHVLRVIDKLEKVGVFTFSPQEGTVAEGLPGQLDDETKKARAERIDFIQDEIMQERAESLVGKTVRVLCEGFDRIAEIWYGRSFAESPDIDGKIFFTAEKGRVRAGAFADVVIDSEEDGEPVGRAV